MGWGPPTAYLRIVTAGAVTDHSKIAEALMSARSQTLHHPSTTGGVQTRLPWWALALPTLAFIVLLALMLNPTHAQAASDPAITHLFERIQQLMAR